MLRTANTSLSLFIGADGQDHPFELIYRFAKERNKMAVSELVPERASVSVWYKCYTPIMLLAKNGEHRAVHFLLDEFDADLGDAIQGYIQGGFIKKVSALDPHRKFRLPWLLGYCRAGNKEQLLAMINYDDDREVHSVLGKLAETGHIKLMKQLQANTSIRLSDDISVLLYAIGGADDSVMTKLKENETLLDWALEGYARVGQFDKVNKLKPAILSNRLHNNLISNAAFGGHFTQVGELLGKDPTVGMLNNAAYGFSFGGYYSEAKMMVAHGANIIKVVDGLSEGGHIQQINLFHKECSKVDISTSIINGFRKENVFDIQQPIINGLKLIEDTELRNKVAENFHLKEASCQKEIDRIGRNIKEYQLPYRLLPALNNKSARIWLLQGHGFFRNNNICQDIFFRIAKYVIGFSLRDTEKVFLAVNKQLLNAVLESNSDTIKNKTVSRKKKRRIKLADKKAEARYQLRINF